MVAFDGEGFSISEFVCLRDNCKESRGLIESERRIRHEETDFLCFGGSCLLCVRACVRETIVVRSDIIIILGYNNNLEAKRGFWGKESVGKYGVQRDI